MTTLKSSPSPPVKRETKPAQSNSDTSREPQEEKGEDENVELIIQDIGHGKTQNRDGSYSRLSGRRKKAP